MTSDEIAEYFERLREAGARLKKRPSGEVIEVLGTVLERWRDPDSVWRRDLEDRLPAATGFTAPMIREGLRRALADWTGDALRELAIRELGPIDPVGAVSNRSVSGFDTTAVLLAGSIPMPSLLALIAPLALRSPVLAKAASRDPLTPHLVAQSIAEADAELGRCIRVVDFAATDEGCTRALLEADCICATGSDATIATVQSLVRPPRRLVVDGHRLSIAAVVPPASAELRGELAERLAVDIALWDQLGCLSPVAIFAVDPEPAHAAALGEAIAVALAKAEANWPRGSIAANAAHEIAQQRAEAELRRAAGRAVEIHASDATTWTVIVEDGPEPRPAPLHRFIRVVPVPDPAHLLEAIQPLAAHLAAVAIEGFGEQTPGLARTLASLGTSRVCAPGSMQSPPLDWRHAGRGVLAPLARFGDIEAIA
ncbi:MAG: hypothetical protein JRF15_00640 [Deltaproteobacteria bacterium]|nr:hypothetical protein [Deltaproteobacteria bacterium]